MAAHERFERGTLAAAIASRSARALREGLLVPIPTRAHVVEDGGIPFIVRVLAQLELEREAKARQQAAGTNPFLPYDEALRVADLSDTHLCLLNRFNVVERHVLIVTRVFEEQQEPLGPADLAALWTCLEETRGLGFYNAGEAAGASQRHKHLQVVPLPLGSGDAFPLAERLEALAPREGVAVPRGLPFPVALASLEALDRCRPDAAAAALEALYREMLRRTGVVPGRAPYNLLATRRWLWLVPRSRPDWQGIAVNALGFAGALLVPDDAALARLRAVGPLALLRAVTPEAGRV
jgi:ATP adenylyltransferase